MSDSPGATGGSPGLIDDAADEVSLSLNAPEPATTVAPEDAAKTIAVKPEVAQHIDALVAAFVDGISDLDVHGDEFRRSVDYIDALADREIRATSEMSNRLLDRPLRAVSGLGNGNSHVAKSLLELRHSLEDLNPSKHDPGRAAPRKLLGLVPVGDRTRRDFARYQKSQSHIQRIVAALLDDVGELEQENAAIGQEQKALFTQMETLRQYAYMAERLDASLEARCEALGATQKDRARALRDEVLFAARRRRQEILMQLAVAVQGYAALRVVEVNNRELIRALRTATTTTVAALRTAVMVAEAATTQRLVGDQVEAVLAGLDRIDAYKLRAHEAMEVTVHDLSDQVQRAQAHVRRLPAGEPAQVRPAIPGEALRLP